MMSFAHPAIISLLAIILSPPLASAADVDSNEVPRELVHWVPYKGNPVFAGTGRDTWDRHIRERGYILHEGSNWRMWYTGYNPIVEDNRSSGIIVRDGKNLRLYTMHPDVCVFLPADETQSSHGR